MICFRDMTFCSAECATEDCARNWTPEQQEEARKWWETWDSPGGPPVAFSDFSSVCPQYQENLK